MLDLLRDRGVPIHRQHFTWTELAQPPISKLDTDAFTRIRVILMAALEAEAVHFDHAVARLYPRLHRHLAVIRRIEHYQQTLVAGLLPPDLTPLETMIAVEQAEIEITAAVARDEPDPAVTSVYRFGLLEDVVDAVLVVDGVATLKGDLGTLVEKLETLDLKSSDIVQIVTKVKDKASGDIANVVWDLTGLVSELPGVACVKLFYNRAVAFGLIG